MDIEAYIRIMRDIPTHDDMLTFDSARIVALLGQYSSLYAYLSEAYAQALIGVKHASKDDVPNFRLLRDVLDQALHVVKFHYESLSRKLTVFMGELQCSKS